MEGYENNLSQNTDFYDSVESLFLCAISVLWVLYVLYVFPLVLSMCHQYSWPAVQRAVLIAAGQSEAYLSSTTIIRPSGHVEAQDDPLIAVFCCQPASASS